jgi:phosphate-selective porin OprO/OprP
LLSVSSVRAEGQDDAARLARLEAAVAALQAQVQDQSRLAAENATLKSQVSALQAKVSALSSQPGDSIKTIPTTSSAGNAPAVVSTFASGEPGIATADGRFSANLYALIQFDAVLYDQGPAAPIATDLRRSGPALGATSANFDDIHARGLKNGDEFRRARFGVSGNAFGDLDYRVVFDFGGSGVENAGQLYEGWAQYSGFRPFHIRVGAFAPQEGLADQDSNAAQPLLDRPISADVARSFAAGDTRTAVEIFGSGSTWLASVALTGRTVGVISSSGTAVPQTFGDPLNVVTRVVYRPYQNGDKLIHLGLHGQEVITPADASGPPTSGASPLSRYSVSFADTPELRVDATKLVNTGSINASHAYNEGVEFAAQWKGLLVQSEYDAFQVDRTDPGTTNPHFQGWYLEASWIPGGAARRYNNGTAAFDAPPVRHPVGQGGLGLVEFTFRYSTLDLNYDSGAPGSAPAASAIRGGDISIWTGGINWYLNPYARVAFEAQHVELSRLSPSASVYLTPIGAQIGQTYNAFAVRSQFGF